MYYGFYFSPPPSLPTCRYYDKQGSPTSEWYKTQELLSQKEQMEAERREMEKKFPGCNSRWNKEEGGHVYCSEKRWEMCVA